MEITKETKAKNKNKTVKSKVHRLSNYRRVKEATMLSKIMIIIIA